MNALKSPLGVKRIQQITDPIEMLEAILESDETSQICYQDVLTALLTQAKIVVETHKARKK